MSADLLPEYDGPERRKNLERRAEFCPVHESNLVILRRLDTKLSNWDKDVIPKVHSNDGTVRTMKWIGAAVAGCAFLICLMVFEMRETFGGYKTKHEYEAQVGFAAIAENKGGIKDNSTNIEKLFDVTRDHDGRLKRIEKAVQP